MAALRHHGRQTRSVAADFEVGHLLEGLDEGMVALVAESAPLQGTAGRLGRRGFFAFPGRTAIGRAPGSSTVSAAASRAAAFSAARACRRSSASIWRV